MSTPEYNMVVTQTWIIDSHSSMQKRKHLKFTDDTEIEIRSIGLNAPLDWFSDLNIHLNDSNKHFIIIAVKL